jgi:hypothetical protein
VAPDENSVIARIGDDKEFIVEEHAAGPVELRRRGIRGRKS